MLAANVGIVYCNNLILHCVCLQALEVTVARDGWLYKQTYSRGKPITNLIADELPADKKDLKGTTIHFWPDKEGQLLNTIPVILLAIIF